MNRYIHELPNWPDFKFDLAALGDQLASVQNRQGLFLSKISALGFDLRQESTIFAITEDVQKSSEIEGELFDRVQIRSSVARHLGIDVGFASPIDRNVDGMVELMLDATLRYYEPLTKDRLFQWHGALFPTWQSGLRKIRAASWRDDSNGAMRVVSGPHGRERVHFEAPSANRLDSEAATFLDWFEMPTGLNLVLKAAIAHLWFVTIHPFEDGNGRIARAIADMSLSRAERLEQRFYSMSSQIRKQQQEYYDILERTQKGSLEITPWIVWFLGCLDRSIQAAESTLGGVLRKAALWDALKTISMNHRQQLMLNKLIDGFEGKLTTDKWAKIAKCSHDTALRDIQDLICKSVLSIDSAGGRSTSYSLRPRTSGFKLHDATFE